MVDDLNISPGHSILDQGCGPGLWTSLLYEKIKPNGRIVGLDIDEDLIGYAAENLIGYAAENLTKQDKEIIDFQVGDFYSLPFVDESFDLVFFGNCFAYVTDHQRVLKEQKRVTKKGVRIALKDFEGSVLVFHPIAPLLMMKVLTSTVLALEEEPPNPPFDNYSGRKLHGLLLKEGLKNVSSKSYAVQIYSPLTPEAKNYIVGNAQWYANKGKAHLSTADFEEWHAYFDLASDQYILDSEEFYFCMLETMAVGEV